MTDISSFEKILQQPYAPIPVYVRKVRWTWIVGYKTTSGRFAYYLSGPLSKLRTYRLADARAAAESLGLPVKEYGPPEAFGRKRYRPSESTIQAYRHVASLGDVEKLVAWLKEHPADVPTLLELTYSEQQVGEQ
jgi:hypothetical protein